MAHLEYYYYISICIIFIINNRCMQHIMHQSGNNIPIWREEDDENNYSTRNCFLNCEEEEVL